MVNAADSDERPRTIVTPNRPEHEHARRNALQLELLRRAQRRSEHQAYIDRALRRVRQEPIG